MLFLIEFVVAAVEFFAMALFIQRGYDSWWVPFICGCICLVFGVFLFIDERGGRND